MMDSELECFFLEGMALYPPDPGADSSMIFKLTEKKQDTAIYATYADILDRRERVLIIPVIDLLSIISGRVRVVLPEEIPPDSLPLRVFQDDNGHAIGIVCAHADFDKVPSGYVMPRYNIIVEFIAKSNDTGVEEKFAAGSGLAEDSEREV